MSYGNKRVVERTLSSNLFSTTKHTKSSKNKCFFPTKVLLIKKKRYKKIKMLIELQGT